MRLDRLSYEPAALVDFYEAGLGALGALCERTWHDRLEVVGEGQSAKLWNPDGALHEIELAFAPADAASARDAAREVFPGCPLTFRLAEALRPVPLALENIILAAEGRVGPPDPAVAEKLWRAQFPDTNRWRLTDPFKPDHHFALVALARFKRLTSIGLSTGWPSRSPVASLILPSRRKSVLRKPTLKLRRPRHGRRQILRAGTPCSASRCKTSWQLSSPASARGRKITFAVNWSA